MKHNKKYLVQSFILITMILLFNFKDEHDSLHNRTFTIALSETRNGVVKKKVIMDKFYFKNGKMRSDFLKEKFDYNWIRYRINKDSIYTDETNTQVRLLEIEASYTDEMDQTVNITFNTLEWDLDGVMKITKHDKLKRYYDVSGRQKLTKPKKIKKRKKKHLIQWQDPWMHIEEKEPGSELNSGT